MNTLVLGGTRYFGVHLVEELLRKGHSVTIATRGKANDSFGDRVSRIIIERTSSESIAETLKGNTYDVVFDNLAYCSNDVKTLLDNISCKRYIMTSTTAVYAKHMDTIEDEYNPLSHEVVWCSRIDFPYDEIKRQAENALFQSYSHINSAAVRFPFVIGTDDYTKRLFFYVEHAIKGIPMYIDNLKDQMGFIRSDEAGRFLALIGDQRYRGAINGSSFGTVSIEDILKYVEKKTGKKATLSDDGEKAPYNGEKAYSISTDRAVSLGFEFTKLKEWLYEMLDYYIDQVNQK